MQSKHQNTKTRARKIEGMKKIKAAYDLAKSQGNLKTTTKVLDLS